MNITPPFGYDEIVPLERNHRVLLPQGAIPSFARNINAIAVSSSEFTLASRDYPLVFASNDGGRTFSPVVVLGLQANVNLFVDAQQEWDRSTYVPAFVRRYPFCLSKVFVDGVAQDDRVVCVAKAYLDSAGKAMLKADGSATDEWTGILRLLQEYEADMDRTALICATLARLNLFVPFKMEVKNEFGPGLVMEGMYRVDEPRFKALAAKTHHEFVENGIMPFVYGHLFSLENFARLVDRSMRIQAGEASAAKNAAAARMAPAEPAPTPAAKAVPAPAKPEAPAAVAPSRPVLHAPSRPATAARAPAKPEPKAPAKAAVKEVPARKTAKEPPAPTKTYARKK